MRMTYLLRSVPLGFKGGQVTISLVFVIGIIIALVGVTLAFLALSFLNSGYGFQAAQKALAIASGGAEDALLRFARDKDFGATAYVVPLGADTAQVTITKNSPQANLVTIISDATVSLHERKIQVIASVDPTNGRVNLISWQQVAL